MDIQTLTTFFMWCTVIDGALLLLWTTILYVGPGFCVPYAKHMVSHSARNLQRGFLRFPRIVQNLFYRLQCRSLRGDTDHRINGLPKIREN